MSVTELDLLRDKIYSGGRVTLKDWSAARAKDAAADERAALEAEFAAPQAERQRIAERTATLEALRADVVAFSDECLEGLRDSYAAYVAARAELSDRLDGYVDGRWALARRAIDVPDEVDLPPELNKPSILNLADREAQGESILRHLLHAPKGQVAGA